MLFEFEDDPYGGAKAAARDACDVRLAIALSNSMKRVPGEQILSPAAVQEIIAERTAEILRGGQAAINPPSFC